MTLLEVLPYVRCLSRRDRLRLIQMIAGEFVQEDFRATTSAEFAPQKPVEPVPTTVPPPIPKRERRYPGEEVSRRGQEIYERDIKPTLKPEDDGKYIAIDIETGMYEMDANDRIISDRLFVRRPQAQQYVVRVGYKAAGLLGGSWESAREVPK